jgi:PAS domain S-box-containing protein
MLTRLIEALRPARNLPPAVRYLLTVAITVVCVSPRFFFPQALAAFPFLLVFPTVLLVAVLFDSGAGVLAAVISVGVLTAMALKPHPLFLAPRTGLIGGGLIYLGVGIFTAGLIESLRRSAEALRVSEAQGQREREILERVFAQSPDPMVVVDPDSRCLRVNDVGAAFVGVSKDDVIGLTFSDFFPPHEAALVEALTREIVRSRQGMTVDVTLTPPSGTPRTFLISSAPVFSDDGEVFGVVTVAKDIHERKALEEYKALLLVDMNHRVKNDLHSIASFLELSARRTKDPAALDVLAAAVRRIKVLARVYDMLRPAGWNVALSAKEFIETLCEDLKAGFTAIRPVEFRVRVDEAGLEKSRAVAVGLIINELVTNAVKYAFPGERIGTIDISFTRDGEDFRLRVADDGVGSSGQEPTGTGSRLVRLLAQQLGGTIERSGPPGTSVCVKFPVHGRGEPSQPPAPEPSALSLSASTMAANPALAAGPSRFAAPSSNHPRK